MAIEGRPVYRVVARMVPGKETTKMKTRIAAFAFVLIAMAGPAICQVDTSKFGRCIDGKLVSNMKGDPSFTEHEVEACDPLLLANILHRYPLIDRTTIHMSVIREVRRRAQILLREHMR
jgi:hypothetical protein